MKEEAMPPAQQPERLAVSPAEAARLLGIGRTFLYEVMRSGKLRNIKVGARRLIPLSAIRELLETSDVR